MGAFVQDSFSRLQRCQGRLPCVKDMNRWLDRDLQDYAIVVTACYMREKPRSVQWEDEEDWAALSGYKVEVPLVAEREVIAKYPKMGL